MGKKHIYFYVHKNSEKNAPQKLLTVDGKGDIAICTFKFFILWFFYLKKIKQSYTKYVCAFSRGRAVKN